MKRIIRLTESDLTRIVRRTINEMEDEVDTQSFFDPQFIILKEFLTNLGYIYMDGEKAPYSKKGRLGVFEKISHTEFGENEPGTSGLKDDYLYRVRVELDYNIYGTRENKSVISISKFTHGDSDWKVLVNSNVPWVLGKPNYTKILQEFKKMGEEAPGLYCEFNKC